jgi:hypothetical protein
VAVKMNKTFRALALLALAPCGGCTGLAFEPTENWWRDGGRMCAASRDTAGLEWSRAAPRSCGRALAATPVPAEPLRDASMKLGS